MKRLGVYVFYDKHGRADECALELVRAVKEMTDELVCVVNGALDESSSESLEALCDTIIRRDNAGFDAMAYREGILAKKDALCEYDELVLFNGTVFGPLYPLREMFGKMSGKSDFWGVTYNRAGIPDPWGLIEGGVMPGHLQTYFIAVGRRMLCDPRFVEYFENLGPINTYREAVCRFEVVFTKHFADLGYSYKSYIDAPDADPFFDNPLMYDPLPLVRDMRCPFIKRKSLFEPFEDSRAFELYEYLKQINPELLSRIIGSITATASSADLTAALGLYRDPATLKPDDGVCAATLSFVAVPDVGSAKLAPFAARFTRGTRTMFACENEDVKNAVAELCPDAETLLCTRHPFAELCGRLNTDDFQYVVYLSLSSDEQRRLTLRNAALCMASAVKCAQLLANEPFFGALVPCAISADPYFCEPPELFESLCGIVANTEGFELIASKLPALCGCGAFAAKIRALRALCKLDFDKHGAALFSQNAPLHEYLIAPSARAERLLCGVCEPSGMTGARLEWTRKRLLAANEMWRADGFESEARIASRMDGVLDFYRNFFAKKSFKEKLFLVLMLFMRKERFRRVFHLEHSAPDGGSMYPTDRNGL